MTSPRPDMGEMGAGSTAPSRPATARNDPGAAPRGGGFAPDHAGEARGAGEAFGAGGRNGRAPSRGDLVSLAIQLDATIARAEGLGLAMTTYLLAIARADLSERLGERRARPSDGG